MKILKVKIGQMVSIAGGKVFVTLHSIGSGSVRLGFDTDPSITIRVIKTNGNNN